MKEQPGHSKDLPGHSKERTSIPSPPPPHTHLDPAPPPVTVFAGQPQFRSTRGAPRATRNMAASASSSALAPMIWAPAVTGGGGNGPADPDPGTFQLCGVPLSSLCHPFSHSVPLSPLLPLCHPVSHPVPPSPHNNKTCPRASLRSLHPLSYCAPHLTQNMPLSSPHTHTTHPEACP